jgi:hypothetical protein
MLPFGSVAGTVKFAAPAAVGVPASAPAALSEIPAGRLPAETVQVYGPVPPPAASVCEYAVPTAAFGKLPVVTVSAPAVTAMLSDLVAVAFAASVTCAVKVAVPPALGVPVIAPDALRAKPAGRVPLASAQV